MKIPCSIIEDLLPNYIDGCTSEETTSYIKEHLNDCDGCRKIYDQMQHPIVQEVPQDIKFLRKIKKRNAMKIILSILITLSICVSAIFVKVYVIGSETRDVYISDVRIQEGKIVGNARSKDHKKSIYQMSMKQDGEQAYVSFMSAPISIFHKGEVFEEFEVDIKSIKGYLFIDDVVFDSKGNVYNRLAYDMYQNRIDYVGDASGLHKLLELAFQDIGNNTDFNIELDTDTEPYAFTVNFNHILSKEQQTQIEQRLKYVLTNVKNCNIAYFTIGSDNHKVEYEWKADTLKDFQDLIVSSDMTMRIKNFTVKHTYANELYVECYNLEQDIKEKQRKLDTPSLPAEKQEELKKEISELMGDLLNLQKEYEKAKLETANE